MGGDKVLSYFSDDTREANPFLGMRSIRFSLRNPDIFRQQVRAMLRAGVGRTIRIMFPMVSALDEFLHGRRITLDCVQELQAEGVECEAPAIGMMVEVPSVLPIIDAFAAEADFLSIGSNDLIQYLIAVDRTNEKVADLYRPYHPAVLRSLHLVAESAVEHGTELSVCGDMAHQAEYIPFLIGIGVRTLSVEPTYLPRVRALVAGIELQEAEAEADAMLACTTLTDVEEVMGDGSGRAAKSASCCRNGPRGGAQSSSGTTPSRIAIRVSSATLVTSSLAITCWRWVSTVLTLTESVAAISLAVLPSARS